MYTLNNDMMTGSGENSNVDLMHYNPVSVKALANIGDLKFSSDAKTLELKVADNTTFKIGRDLSILAMNNSGSSMVKGKVVYITGVNAGGAFI